jgi:annexin A13
MTINIYPEIVHVNNLSPDAFGPEIDEYCQEIRDACAGWGASVPKAIEGLAKDATTRHKISLRYKEMFGKDLSEVMKKEFSGDFGVCMKFLALPADQAEAAMLRKATSGVGASVDIIYSITCGRTNMEMEMLKKAFFSKYTKDLNQIIASELRGDNEKLMLNALQASEQVYDPLFHTRDKAIEDAEYLYKSGQGKWIGTDEKSIFKIICSSPPQHLENVNRHYADKYGYTLEKAMEKELGGTAKQGLLFTLGMKLKPYETIAKLIKTACAGIGTNEMLLATAIIRYQHIMKDVMTAHIELYSKVRSIQNYILAAG